MSRLGEFVRDRYELLEVLGEGGQGEVLKARDHQHDRVVAVKVRSAPSAEDRRTLLDEAKALLNVRPHPGLPLVREDFFESDRYFIVMDWVEGRDLAQVLAEEGEPGLPIARALRYVEQAASVLDHLHQHDPPVVHKDVKPANLMLTADDRVVLVDFGLAHPTAPGSATWATSGYTAPELGAGQPPTPASDVYSLAATTFTLITGRAPDGHAPSWEGVPVGHVAALKDALRRGLATDPASRPAAGQFLELLGLRPEDQAALGDTLSRRLAAVWFADIVAPTAAPIETDQPPRRDATLRELASQEVAAHDGTLVRLTDSSLVAHAPSTAAAIDAALSFRERFHERVADQDHPPQVRIGLHLGDVVVSSDDVFGHGVEIAEQLLGEAEPGRIVVSEDVWRQCRRRPELQLVPIGRRELEGLDEPIDIWELAPPDEFDVARELASRTFETEPGEEVKRGTVAVLPFEVLGGSQEAAVLADGLHNDLLTQLSKLSAVTVISRSSVVGYRESDKPRSLIARELSVGTVVEGSVQPVGRRVRLTVQLIDASVDTQLWAETYDREVTPENLFSIQTELTRRIVDSLHTELSPGEEQRLSAPPPTRNVDAYRLAVEGRMQRDRKSAQSLARAVELFEHALEIDPDYVAAWIGLADSLVEMHAYGYGDEESLQRGEQALRRALELGPDSAEVRSSLGLFLGHTQRDGPGAAREQARAIELNPGYADAHSRHAWISRLLGRGDESLEHALRGIELNPLSAEAVTNVAMSYLATGQPDRALVEGRRAQELSPDYVAGYLWEGTALYELGRFSEAIAVLTPLSRDVAGRLTDPWAGLGPDVTLALAHAADGTPAQSERILNGIDPEEDPFAIGLVLTALGQYEPAFDAFGRVDDTVYWPTLAVHYFFPDVWDPIRDDPRFADLVAVAYRSHGAEVEATRAVAVHRGVNGQVAD